MKKRVALFLITTLVSLVLLPLQAGLLGTQKATAWTGTLPQCDNVGLPYWDWPKAIRDHNGGNEFPSFSPENGRYLIGRGNGVYSPNIALYYSTNAGDLILEKTDSTNYQIRSTTDLWVVQIQDAPSQTWPPSYGYSSFTNSPTATSNPNQQIACVYVAKNVVYSSTWDTPTYNSTVEYTNSTNSCKALDFGCWLAKGFKNIGDGFNAVGQAIVKSIALLFSPSSIAVQSTFTDLQTFFNNKLGFLTYPFTFVVDFFNAFNNTSNNWCSSTSCVRSFGNLFGQNFTLDLNVIAHNQPTLWTYLTGFLQAITVLGVLLSIRRKYLEVIQR